MSFEDLLRKKLGPMRDLVFRQRSVEPPVYDPAELYYRRAVGLEARARPEETWSSIQLGRTDRPEKALHSVDAKTAGVILGLTKWRRAGDISGLSPRELWSFVDRDLLFFAKDDPQVPLTGSTGVLGAAAQKIARRASMWPTAAIETGVSIAPMPFMPRGEDLRGAEHVGYRFASLEKGFEVFGATITGSRKTGSLLRTLVPLLDGSRTAEELADEFPRERRADVHNLLELLDRLTVLEAVDSRLSRPQADRAQVTWLGHGGVLVEAGGAAVLIDPLFFSKSDPEERGVFPPKPDPRALPKIDAVFITHGDNDHLNANTLAQLPARTPIYIPRVGERPAPYQVDMRRMLNVLGFTDVYELGEWSAVAIEGLVITACPFAGEDWDLPLAKNTYLVESDDASLFFSADSSRMDEVYTRLGERARRVDLAFMGVSGSAETFVMPDGFGYGNFYREWVPRARHNEWVRHCSGPADAVHSSSLFQPRFAFGYAAGGASYIRTEYSDTGDHAAFAALLRAREGELKTRPLELPLGEAVAIDDLPRRAQ